MGGIMGNISSRAFRLYVGPSTDLQVYDRVVISGDTFEVDEVDNRNDLSHHRQRWYKVAVIIEKQDV